VLFTNRVQVKIYRGQGSDPGLPMRALRSLHSVNAVEPVVDADDSIPPAPRTVLSGSAPCSGSTDCVDLPSRIPSDVEALVLEVEVAAYP
jgi:hypothetical protein